MGIRGGGGRRGGKGGGGGGEGGRDPFIHCFHRSFDPHCHNGNTQPPKVERGNPRNFCPNFFFPLIPKRNSLFLSLSLFFFSFSLSLQQYKYIDIKKKKRKKNSHNIFTALSECLLQTASRLSTVTIGFFFIVTPAAGDGAPVTSSKPRPPRQAALPSPPAAARRWIRSQWPQPAPAEPCQMIISTDCCCCCCCCCCCRRRL